MDDKLKGTIFTPGEMVDGNRRILRKLSNKLTKANELEKTQFLVPFN